MFESIMEAKIKKWEEEKNKPGYVPPPPVKNTFGKPIEQTLIDEIEELVIKASKSTNEEEKQGLLKKVSSLETQLLLSFENQGLYLVAQKTQKRLQKFRMDNL
ncbi:MAG: hypothetical protein ACNI25_07720 [Halarcobacter sp.]